MLILVVIIVVTSIVMIGLNAFYLRTQDQIKIDAYRQGFLTARKQYEALYPQSTAPVTFFTGTVKGVNAQTIVVTQDSLAVDPTVDGVSNDRNVTLAQDGKVSLSQNKDPKAYQAELSTFVPSSTSTPPLPTTNTAMAFSDIKPGDRVIVNATSNVRMEQDIQAESIQVLK